MCKLREAFQGCLHLWSSHSGTHRKYKILKQQGSSVAHALRHGLPRECIACVQKRKAVVLQTVPKQFSTDPLSTSLNSLVFERKRTHATWNRNNKECNSNKSGGTKGKQLIHTDYTERMKNWGGKRKWLVKSFGCIFINIQKILSVITSRKFFFCYNLMLLQEISPVTTTMKRQDFFKSVRRFVCL